MLLLLSLATGPMYKHEVGDFACIYRVPETIYIYDRSILNGQRIYYGYNSRGRDWKVSEVMLIAGKCE